MATFPAESEIPSSRSPAQGDVRRQGQIPHAQQFPRGRA